MSLSILILVTSHDHLDATHRTGTWLEELAVPFAAFEAAGATVTVASLAGGDAPIEPRSLAGVDTRTHADAIGAMLDTRPLAKIDVEAYDAVFVPGGHGPMFDLANDPTVGRALGQMWERGAVVAAVCHGPAALVGATDGNGAPLVRGRQITAFSNAEEEQTGVAASMPFALQTRLQELGGNYEATDAWSPKVVVDGALITGQNPASSKDVAVAVLRALGHEAAA